MIIILSYCLFFAFIILIIGIIFYLQGPPYVPTDDETIKQFVSLAKKYKGKKIIDIGSGDGRIVIALAKAGFDAHGIELNPLLVFKSKKAIKKEGLKNAYIHWGNFWQHSFSSYDILIMYGIKHIMNQFGKKLKKELKPNSYILTNFFIFPSLTHIKKVKRVTIYKT